jgi:bifunctional DNA-binding transcriptional regulator/antitoxin component of YhaV-PrlF toxin-antitoxin module
MKLMLIFNKKKSTFKFMKKLIILFLVILTFNSCNSKKEEVIKINNNYSITIPSYLTKTNKLNDIASLQYENTSKELYVIVIDESIEEMQNTLSVNKLTNLYSNDINGYSDLIMDLFEKQCPPYYKPEILETKIKNLPTRIFTFKAKVNEKDIFYKTAFIQGKKRYYQITTWTLLDKEELNEEKMKKIIFSFNEL